MDRVGFPQLGGLVVHHQRAVQFVAERREARARMTPLAWHDWFQRL